MEKQTNPVKNKRNEAKEKYDRCVKSIMDIVKSRDGALNLEELDKLATAVDEARVVLKELELWEGVIKTEESK